MTWHEGPRISRPHFWQLNSYLLEGPGLRGLIESQIQLFFSINEGTVSTGLLWDSFKAYIRGIFITCKAHRNNIWNSVRSGLIANIRRLEELNKNQVTSEHA